MNSKDYICLRRYICICGEGCIEDLKNVRCRNYYPCHIIAGSAIVEPPLRAKAIHSELLKKLDELESPAPSVEIVPVLELSKIE